MTYLRQQYQVTVYLKTKQPSVVLRHFALHTLECLNFILRKQQPIHIMFLKYLFQSEVSFVLPDFIQSRDYRTMVK